jgi:predicted phage terminase large subunit-like protein
VAPNEHRLLQAALREKFSAFAKKSTQYLNPATHLMWNWHLEAICHALERVRRGEVKRLIITLPPRSLKSTIASIAFPAYLLGQDPSAKVICLSYSADLSNDFARKCRALLNAPYYRELFPGTRISSERDAALDFMTTARGYRLGTSVGGTLTGRGGQFIIIDDILKPDDATSDAKRTSILQWFENTVYTRLDDKMTGAIVIVMQRVHVYDLIGHVLEKGEWDVLNLPAIAEFDETIPIGNGVFHYRKAGELLHPERESRAILDDLKRLMGSYAFEAQYQQRPVPLDGNIFKKSWFRRYNSLPETQCSMTVQSWDTAQSGSPESDYSVCTTWKVYGEQFYLVDLFRQRLKYPDLKRAAINQAALHKPNYVLIEDIGSGMSLIQDLTKERPPHCANPIPIKVKLDKQTRAAQQSATVESQRVYLPANADWVDTLLHELMLFPAGRNDDQVDSFSQFLNWRIHEHIQYAMNIPVRWAY